MNQPNVFSRLRRVVGLLFVLGVVFGPVGASGQTAANFVLTSASWTCANPTVQTAWTAQGTVSSMHIRATNTSLNDAEAMTVTNPSQSSHSLVLSRLDRIDKIAVTAYMSDGSVWEYYANTGNCDVAGTITGGMVDDGSDISIIIMNATCSGFSWSVNSPEAVRVYVNVMDIIGQGMISHTPQNGSVLSGSESYVVETENQTYFNISVMAYDLSTNERLAYSSVPMNCPIASPTTPTPVVTPSVTPDVDERTRVVININMPGGESIEGAPYSIFAPMAAQFAAEPYLQGAVGPNNTIVVFDLIEGQYRLVVEPVGMDPFEVVFTVGADQVTDVLIVVDEDGNAGVVAEQIGQTPTSAPAAPSTGDDAVRALPATGTGESGSAIPVLMFALLTFMVGASTLAVVRRATIKA